MSILHQLSTLLALAADSTTIAKIPVAPAESVAVTVHGEGAPVVLIPGLFGSAFGFRHVIASLVTSGYQAVVVEPLGIGESSRPAKADYSLASQAERVAAGLDSLAVKHAVVVAHSMGAGIAFRLAYQRPDLVAGAISLDGAAWETAASPGLRRALKWAPLMRLFGGAGLVRKKIREGLVQDSYDGSWVTPDVIAAYTTGSTEDFGATLRALQGMARSVEPELLAPHLAEIRCPVILLTGGADRPNRIKPEEQQLLAERIPKFRVDTVARSGHRLHEERPDAVVAAVQSLRLHLASLGDPR
ncbi:MAG: alpha/beta fold hydrolase [Gemmatimonadales bacterium]